MVLKWREDLSVGNDVIDYDHKYFIETINRAQNSLVIMDQQELKNALDSLTFYAIRHFATEEKVASAVGYPHVPRLHDSHEALLEKLAQLKKEIGEEWTQPSGEHFASLLRDWLLNHVIKEDLLMKPFLTKYSPQFDPR